MATPDSSAVLRNYLQTAHDEDGDEEHAFVQRELSHQTVLSPAMIRAVIAEFLHVSGPDALEDWIERTIATDGLGLAAANAARRAQHRLGSVWPLLSFLERFFAPHVSPERAAEARLILARARQGEAPFDGNEYSDRMDAIRSDGVLTRCLGKVELLAYDAVAGKPEHFGHGLALEVFEMADDLSTELHATSAAHELVAGIELLGTGEP